ncbi:Beta-lactamase-like protein 4 [Leucoagaricus sp. SymC.cos]|nr:Beta-lactamase-like protein 4 [Leucoagaricus sp. SymC.cos]
MLGLAGLWAITVGYHRARPAHIQPIKTGCPFPLPNHPLRENPLQQDEGSLAESSRKLHTFLSERTSHSDIDSLSIAIVTPTGTLFEQSYGVLKANETDSDRPVSRDSIYRIASITKMFTVLETLILRERGALNLDDPVEKFLPELRYPAYGWSEYLRGEKDDSSRQSHPRVTLRQLASHMSERNYGQLVESVNKYPLINLPYDYPIYSNSGIDLLGLANVAANNHSGTNEEYEPRSHEDLIKRDIFNPLGLNSFYRVPYGTSLVDNLAVPKENHEWADFLFDNAAAPAGGQYSSLADLETVLQHFLGNYGGRWVNVGQDQEGTTSAEVKIINGGLYMTELVVRGYDVLKIVEEAEISLEKPYPIALWNTGRSGEFRLAFGRKTLNDDPLAGCMPYWVSIDNGLFSRGAPIDVVFWDDGELVYPSAGVRLKRV